MGWGLQRSLKRRNGGGRGQGIPTVWGVPASTPHSVPTSAQQLGQPLTGSVGEAPRRPPVSSGSRHGPGWQWAALDSEVLLWSQAILSERPERTGLGEGLGNLSQNWLPCW